MFILEYGRACRVSCYGRLGACEVQCDSVYVSFETVVGACVVRDALASESCGAMVIKNEGRSKEKLFIIQVVDSLVIAYNPGLPGGPYISPDPLKLRRS